MFHQFKKCCLVTRRSKYNVNFGDKTQNSCILFDLGTFVTFGTSFLIKVVILLPFTHLTTLDKPRSFVPQQAKHSNQLLVRHQTHPKDQCHLMERQCLALFFSPGNTKRKVKFKPRWKNSTLTIIFCDVHLITLLVCAKTPFSAEHSVVPP